MLRLVNAFARRSVEPLAARPALVRLFSSPSASASTSGAGSAHEAGAPAPGKKEVKEGAYAHVSDADVLTMLRRGELLAYNLERDLGDAHRAVTVRRAFLARDVEAVGTLPHDNYKFDYEAVKGACCENVIGFVSLPVGVAGPITVDGVEYHVPLATTEGALVASVHRGCKAISVSGGTHTIVLDDGMTRAPVLTMASAKRAGALREWLNAPDNYAAVEHAFNSTSRFARLKELKMFVAGRTVFLRFKCATGDAMGMNMITKGVTNALDFLQSKFDDLHIVSVSGNVCTDKKPSSINWTDGRGKSVVAEVVIPAAIVEKVLKTTVDALIEVNVRKNLIGSAVAGSIGGFNAHAANIVTALYIACGQDPAQNVESSNCMTLMEKIGQDLHMSVSMPSIEVGTVGGGTNLPPQAACLNMLGVKGAAAVPGENARQLARVVASTVLAGELSLISALAAGHLLRSHMELNRKAHGAHKKH